jgi:hypothetical protein
LRFFFFGFFGFTGALGVRTAEGEMPPVVLPWLATPGLLGPIPPDELAEVVWLEEPLLVPEGAVVPPVAADAPAAPNASAMVMTAAASVRRTLMHPCMLQGIGPPLDAS